MKEFLKALLSQEGSVSAMRVAFLCFLTLVTWTFCICIFIVVWHKKEFPAGIWEAIAAFGGSVAVPFGFKAYQKKTEQAKAPPAPAEGSEPS